MRVRGRRPRKFFLCVKAYILVLDIIHSVGLCPSGLKYLEGQIDNITHAYRPAAYAISSIIRNNYGMN